MSSSNKSLDSTNSSRTRHSPELKELRRHRSTVARQSHIQTTAAAIGTSSSSSSSVACVKHHLVLVQHVHVSSQAPAQASQPSRVVRCTVHSTAAVAVVVVSVAAVVAAAAAIVDLADRC
jgi:hypothetical protein